MKTKFFVMGRVNLAHEQLVLPLWSPFEGAVSFEHAYSSFAYDDEDQAKAEACEEDADLKAWVQSGDLADSEDVLVVKGTLQDDGTLEFEDGSSLTASTIYGHFGIDLPEFVFRAPGP